MKKMVSALLLFCITATGVISAEGLQKDRKVFADIKSHTYVVDGQVKTMGHGYQTLEYGARLYVPIRFVTESLGWKVQYDANGRVVNIVSSTKPNSFYLSSDEESKKEIQMLEEKVARLEKENHRLQEQLKKEKDSVAKKIAEEGIRENISKLPTYNYDNDVKVTLRGSSSDNDGKDLYLNVRVENINSDDDVFQLLPSETVLSVAGDEYVPDLGRSSNSLYNTLHKKDEHIDGDLFFKNAGNYSSDTIYLAKFVYADSSGQNKKEIVVKFKLN